MKEIAVESFTSVDEAEKTTYAALIRARGKAIEEEEYEFGTLYWSQGKDCDDSDAAYLVEGSHGEAPLKIVVHNATFRPHTKDVDLWYDGILPLKTKIDGDDKKLFAQQCILAQIPLCQYEAAEKFLDKDELKAFARNFPKRIGTHGTQEKKAMPESWYEVVEILSQLEDFQGLAMGMADGQIGDYIDLQNTSSCWPPFDPLTRHRPTTKGMAGLMK
jgi:hypothetical protein